MKWRNLLLVIMFGLAGSAWAGSKDVVVKNAWVNETVPGQTRVSVQMDVTCTAASGKLVGVESPLAESGELQRLWPSHGKVTMAPVKMVRLPRGHAVAFSERAISVALLGLKKPLKVGDQLPVTLTVLTGGNKVAVEVMAEVRAAELSYKQYKEVETKDRQ